MDDGRNDIMISQIQAQIPNLYLAELVQVADFIRGIKAARRFLSATGFDK